MTARFDNRNPKDQDIDFKSFLSALSGQKENTEGTQKVSPFKKLTPATTETEKKAGTINNNEIIEKTVKIEKIPGKTPAKTPSVKPANNHELIKQNTGLIKDLYTGKTEPNKTKTIKNTGDKEEEPGKLGAVDQLMPSPTARPMTQQHGVSREARRTVPTGRDEDASTYLMGTSDKSLETPIDSAETAFLPQEQIAASQTSMKTQPPAREETRKLKAPETGLLPEDKVIEKIEAIKTEKKIGTTQREEKPYKSQVALPHISVKPQFTLEQLFETMIREGASDLHVSTGSVPALRINGEVTPLELPDLNLEFSEDLLLPILSEEQRTFFEDEGELDFSFDYRNKARFRINYFRHHRGIGGVFRYIPPNIFNPEQLGLPPVIKNLLKFKKGLIIVAGPSSSGKSTTIASMLDEINRQRKARIITLEKPIEYVMKSEQSLISQREIGTTAVSYSEALWAVLREDPDVIMVGELWDTEDIRQVLKISETGHLVITAIHTVDSTKAIERLINAFPQDEQDQIRIILSECLLGVIAQRLLPRADNRGLVLASEVLLATTGLAAIIREGKYSQIVSVIQTGRNLGMQTMDQSLLDLLERNFITADVAKTLVLDDRFFRRAGIRFGND